MMATLAKKMKFFDPGELVHRDLKLVLQDTMQAQPGIGLFYPRYIFCMVSTNKGAGIVGDFEFRIGDDEFLAKYAGHVYYSVLKKYRGRKYAVRSCRLIYPLARRHGLKALWVTCNPDNVASRRTCEILGGKMRGIAKTPVGSYYHQVGELKKCRYFIDI